MSSSAKIMAVVAAIATIGAAISAIDTYRWWPWIWEYKALATETYEMSARQTFEFLIITQDQLKKCEMERSKDPRAPICLDLKQLEREYQEKLEEIKKKQEEVK